MGNRRIQRVGAAAAMSGLDTSGSPLGTGHTHLQSGHVTGLRDQFLAVVDPVVGMRRTVERTLVGFGLARVREMVGL